MNSTFKEPGNFTQIHNSVIRTPKLTPYDKTIYMLITKRSTLLLGFQLNQSSQETGSKTSSVKVLILPYCQGYNLGNKLSGNFTSISSEY